MYSSAKLPCSRVYTPGLSVILFNTDEKMQESAWQGRDRDGQVPRTDTGTRSAAAGTADGGEEEIWGEEKKKGKIREEASMRKK